MWRTKEPSHYLLSEGFLRYLEDAGTRAKALERVHSSLSASLNQRLDSTVEEAIGEQH
jgi:hypothetical protein